MLATALAPVFELYAALDAPVIDRALAHAQPGGPNSGFEGGLYFKTSDVPATLHTYSITSSRLMELGIASIHPSVWNFRGGDCRLQ